MRYDLAAALKAFDEAWNDLHPEPEPEPTSVPADDGAAQPDA